MVGSERTRDDLTEDSGAIGPGESGAGTVANTTGADAAGAATNGGNTSQGDPFGGNFSARAPNTSSEDEDDEYEDVEDEETPDEETAEPANEGNTPQADPFGASFSSRPTTSSTEGSYDEEYDDEETPNEEPASPYDDQPPMQAVFATRKQIYRPHKAMYRSTPLHKVKKWKMDPAGGRKEWSGANRGPSRLTVSETVEPEPETPTIVVSEAADAEPDTPTSRFSDSSSDEEAGDTRGEEPEATDGQTQQKNEEAQTPSGENGKDELYDDEGFLIEAASGEQPAPVQNEPVSMTNSDDDSSLIAQAPDEQPAPVQNEPASTTDGPNPHDLSPVGAVFWDRQLEWMCRLQYDQYSYTYLHAEKKWDGDVSGREGWSVDPRSNTTKRGPSPLKAIRNVSNPSPEASPTEPEELVAIRDASSPSPEPSPAEPQEEPAASPLGAIRSVSSPSSESSPTGPQGLAASMPPYQPKGWDWMQDEEDEQSIQHFKQASIQIDAETAERKVREAEEKAAREAIEAEEKASREAIEAEEKAAREAKEVEEKAARQAKEAEEKAAQAQAIANATVRAETATTSITVEEGVDDGFQQESQDVVTPLPGLGSSTPSSDDESPPTPEKQDAVERRMHSYRSDYHKYRDEAKKLKQKLAAAEHESATSRQELLATEKELEKAGAAFELEYARLDAERKAAKKETKVYEIWARSNDSSKQNELSRLRKEDELSGIRKVFKDAATETDSTLPSAQSDNGTRSMGTAMGLDPTVLGAVAGAVTGGKPSAAIIKIRVQCDPFGAQIISATQTDTPSAPVSDSEDFPSGKSKRKRQDTDRPDRKRISRTLDPFSGLRTVEDAPRPAHSLLRPEFNRWPIKERKTLAKFITKWINDHLEPGSSETPFSEELLSEVLGDGCLRWDQLISELQTREYIFRPDRLARALSDPDTIRTHELPLPTVEILYEGLGLATRAHDRPNRYAESLRDLLAEVRRLLEMVCERDAKILKRDDDIYALDTEVETLRGEAFENEDTIDELETQASEYEETLRLTNDLNEDLEGRLSESEETIREMLEKFLGSDSGSNEGDADTEATKLAECREHGRQLQESLDSTNEKLAEEESRNQILVDQRRELQMEMAKLENVRDSKKGDDNDELRRQIAASNECVRLLIDNHKKTVAGLDRTVANLEKRLAEKDAADDTSSRSSGRSDYHTAPTSHLSSPPLSTATPRTAIYDPPRRVLPRIPSDEEPSDRSARWARREAAIAATSGAYRETLSRLDQRWSQEKQKRTEVDQKIENMLIDRREWALGKKKAGDSMPYIPVEQRWNDLHESA